MSLDVYLEVDEPVVVEGTGIFIRVNGQNREITAEEWNELHPDRPIPAERMAEYAAQERVTNEVYSANITHNLNRMAEAAGIYQACWRPEEIGVTTAKQLVPLLTEGLAKLKADPKHYEQFNSPNGWGLYEHFVPWVEAYLRACEEYPEATVRVWR